MRLARALEQMTHRGPDDGAEAFGDTWYMGFRRLAILDLSPAGRQPMRFASGRCTLTFNGEIYNHKELRAARAGQVFQSPGDTAVLGALLEQEPPAAVLGRLRGMFAFAWWDEAAQTLVAARDPFGIKPLYYAGLPDGTLMISSEIRAVQTVLGPDLLVSRRAIRQFFRRGSVQAPDTMFQGVKCLPPGHLLRWKGGLGEVERYFTPRWPGREAWLTGDAALAATRQVIRGSVAAHLVSDVPVGVFLSGGLDSTLMAALMKEGGAGEVQAFSIGFEENAGVPDESDVAGRTAEFLGCKFTRERLTSADLFGHLDAYLESLDQPTGDALNTWLVSRVAARHVKAVLSGLGADEWFAGYNYHRLFHLARSLPLGRGSWGSLAAGLVRLADGVAPARLQGHKAWKALFYASGAGGRDIPAMHAHARGIFSEVELEALLELGPGEGADLETAGPAVRDLEGRAPDSWLHQLLLLETDTYLADTLLRDNDVTSMAHSLELRVPLVDREVFDLAGRLDPATKLDLRGGKRILRAAFHDLLPPWIAQDTRKKTFTLPLMKWMRNPPWKDLITGVLTSQACRERGWMAPAQVQRHLENYYGSGIDDKRGWRLSQIVWLMFVLESWALRSPGPAGL